jgi:hypothetical protein
MAVRKAKRKAKKKTAKKKPARRKAVRKKTARRKTAKKPTRGQAAAKAKPRSKPKPKYTCVLCGVEVTVSKEGLGISKLMCCGHPMRKK